MDQMFGELLWLISTEIMEYDAVSAGGGSWKSRGKTRGEYGVADYSFLVAA